MNPLVFLFVLGAASAAPQTLIETGLGERFPIVYEYPKNSIILGNLAHPAVQKTPVESVYQIGEQSRPFYVQTVIPGNQGHQLDRPIQKIVLNKQDGFPIYTPSEHILHHGTPNRPQTYEEENDHHVARSLYPGSADREVVYIYPPILRQRGVRTFPY